MADRLLVPSQWLKYLAGNRLRILMFHRIAYDEDDHLAVRPDSFTEQMAYLRCSGWDVVSLSQALDRIRLGLSLRKCLCLTFDDGYLDFKSSAYPILQEHDFHATLFVVASLVGEQSAWRSDRRMFPLMDWEDLRSLSGSGFEIGSHSLSHSDLTKLGDAELCDDCARSRLILEENLGVPVKYLAYPGGVCGSREKRAAETAGYKGAVIVGGRWGNGKETCPYSLRREKMLGSDGIREFKRKVDGYDELHYLWRWFTHRRRPQ